MATSKINNEFKGKVMKAAWTKFRKSSKSFSVCLKSAWAWAKENLLKEFTIWSPKEGFGRIYFGDAYMQYSIKENSPKGYYQSHRACKGESFAIAYYKLVGLTIEQVSPFFGKIECAISNFGQNISFVESKF